MCLAAAQFHGHGGGQGDHKSARVESGGDIAAFDGTLAQMLQNACEAIPPLPRKSLRDEINVSHIVLIVANKCLNGLMYGREIIRGRGGKTALEVCGLITG